MKIKLYPLLLSLIFTLSGYVAFAMEPNINVAPNTHSEQSFNSKNYSLPVATALSSPNAQEASNGQNINPLSSPIGLGNFVHNLGYVTFVNNTNVQLLMLFDQNDVYLSLHGAQIVLNPGSYVTLPVKAPNAKNEYKESYIQVKALPSENYYDFLGVESLNGVLKVDGYESYGIAMSWTKAPNLLVTFCSHNDYVANGNTCF